jgi:hypothetical protein
MNQSEAVAMRQSESDDMSIRLHSKEVLGYLFQPATLA